MQASLAACRCACALCNRRFDFPLLRAECIRCGVELPGDWLCLDTLVLARKLSLRQRAGAERQGQLLGFYGIPW